MDRFSGPSGMLAVRDACDKRANNHEDGGVSLPRGNLCSARNAKNNSGISLGLATRDE